MDKKRNVLTIRVPEDLKDRIEKYSAIQGVSINQFALYAFTKELAELETNRYFSSVLKERTKDENLKDFDRVMQKVQPRPVPDWDRNE